MLRLITIGALSSALTASLADEFLAMGVTLDEDLALVRGLRPWNEMLEGVRWWVAWFFWMVEKMGVNKADEAAMVPAECGLREILGHWRVKKQ